MKARATIVVLLEEKTGGRSKAAQKPWQEVTVRTKYDHEAGKP
ncbi:MAG: hypothetical protein ACLSUW_09910 [Akkermansia sp.]